MSFITEQIIAMGYPSESIEGWYRNSIRDVQDFFRSYHAKHYKIYNLCSERKYGIEGWDTGSVNEEFGFDDHNPPPFDLIMRFCSDCYEYLNRDKENVVAIHCKAGKGRTGVMICCYLVFEGHQKSLDPDFKEMNAKLGRLLIKNSKDAMVYYGIIRTHDGKGVTIPSQIRYVYYFDHYLKLLTYKMKMSLKNNLHESKIFKHTKLHQLGWKMPKIVMKLYKIRIITTPKINAGGFDPSFKVYCKYSLFYDSIKYQKPKFIENKPHSDFTPTF